jgi:hypothetical protein
VSRLDSRVTKAGQGIVAQKVNVGCELWMGGLCMKGMRIGQNPHVCRNWQTLWGHPSRTHKALDVRASKIQKIKTSFKG